MGRQQMRYWMTMGSDKQITFKFKQTRIMKEKELINDIIMENTERLIKEKIKGTRKGLSEDNYLHSFKVRDILKESWYDYDVCLAWLLHDVIEDGWMTAEELLAVGYSENVVKIVQACSHDDTIKDSFTKWKTMMDKIDESWDIDALIVKIADVTDNMKTCSLLMPESYYGFLFKKAPYVMELMYKYLDAAEFDVSPLKDMFFDVWNSEKMHYTGEMFDKQS